jgi:hypothetical protein
MDDLRHPKVLIGRQADVEVDAQGPGDLVAKILAHRLADDPLEQSVAERPDGQGVISRPRPHRPVWRLSGQQVSHQVGVEQLGLGQFPARPAKASLMREQLGDGHRALAVGRERRPIVGDRAIVGQQVLIHQARHAEGHHAFGR